MPQSERNAYLCWVPGHLGVTGKVPQLTSIVSEEHNGNNKRLWSEKKWQRCWPVSHHQKNKREIKLEIFIQQEK